MYGDNRKLFGVPDEILDVTRSSGMVRKRGLIYRKSCFGHRKSFGLIGNVPGVPGGYRGTTGRGVTTPGPHGILEEVDQPLVRWPKPPLRAHVAGVEGKEKNSR